MNRLKRILFILLVVIIFYQQCFATIKGRVISQKSGEPVKYAKIEVMNSTEITLTDKNGIFSLDNIDSEDRIEVSHLGYEKKIVEIFPSLNKPIIIEVSPKSIKIDGISVKDEMNNSSSFIPNVDNLVEITDFQDEQLINVLNQQAGIFISENASGNKTLSLNGFDSKQVAVMIDGMKINSGGEVFSIDKIPLDIVEKVEIVSGNKSSLGGNSAMGGIVNFILKSPESNSKELNISSNIGSWNSYSLNLNSHFDLGYTSSMLNLNAKTSENDFEYYNNIEDTTIRRNNNDVKKYSFTLKNETPINKNILNSFSAFWEKESKGIPGQSTDYMYYKKARSNSKFYYFKNRIQLNLPHSFIKWKNYFQFQETHYENRDSDFFHSYDSKNITKNYESTVSYKIFSSAAESEFSLGYREESYKFENLLDNSSTNSIPRKYRSFLYFANNNTFTVQKNNHKIEIRPHFRFDTIINEKDMFSY